MKSARLAAILLVVLASLLILVDLLSPPEHQLSAGILIFSIEKYREYGSPHLAGAVTCKFKPSCSSYAIIAFKKTWSLKGTIMTITRLAKCSPLSSAHGEDYP